METDRARAAAIEGRLAALAAAVAQQPNAKDLRELRQAVRAVAPDDDRQLYHEVERIAASRLPIVIGPWTGELGFELIYWIPFVDWVRHQWSLDPARLMIVSRGGVEAWYQTERAAGAGRYADIFSFVPPDEFRTAVAEEKRKQRHISSFDRRIVDAVVARHGMGEVELLHPRLMFRLFAAFWSETAGYARVDQFTRRRLLDVPADERPADLPPEYVAVRFYFSECFPDTPANRSFAAGAVAAIAERVPVVLLNPGFRPDDHEDWSPDARGRIHVISGGMDPARNLAVQSAIIAGARAFAGTYGGYSYLAPLLRVPAIAFYSRPTFKWHHLYAAQRAFDDAGAAPLTLLDVAQAPMIEAAFARATAGVSGEPTRAQRPAVTWRA
jgi:hypothetical protein